MMQDYYVTTLSSLQQSTCTSPVMSKRTATPFPLVLVYFILARCDMCYSLSQG